MYLNELESVALLQKPLKARVNLNQTGLILCYSTQVLLDSQTLLTIVSAEASTQRGQKSIQMCNCCLSESIQVLVCVIMVGLDHNIELRLNINSFPPNTELYGFLCFHCYTLEGAIAHLLNEYRITRSKTQARKTQK